MGHDRGNPTLRRIAMLALAAAPGGAIAQSQLISLGSGGPVTVVQTGGTTTVMGGGIGASVAGVWTLNGATLTTANFPGTVSGAGYMSADGAYAVVLVPNANPRVFGNTATGVNPPFRPDPTLVPSTTNPQATETRAARLNLSNGTLQDLGGLPIDGSLLVFGSGSSGGSTGSFVIPTGISSDGRFIIGRGYISSYNSSAGTTISDNTFQWRPFVWDAQANAGAGGFTVLPTPFRTSTNTWRRRTGNTYDISADGTVIVGAQEHNVGAAPAADPDGGRLVVWRLNTTSGLYEMTYLPNGVNESGFPYTYSTTQGTVHMNDAGTIIVGNAVGNDGLGFIGRWTWDGNTSTWTGPENLGSDLETEASWLPGIVTSCGVPPIITPLGMTEDGETIVGSARYSTCGSFMTAGFIRTATSGGLVDWYDYLVAQGVPGVTDYYGPIGDNGDPTRGLPKLGSPLGINANGNAVINQVLGPMLIVGAPPSLLLMSGGPGCVAPLITNQPASTLFSACSSSVILNVFAAGTQPITYQWYKDGSPLADGATPSGSNINGAANFQLRVEPLLTPSDAGNYNAVATGVCGAPVPSNTAVVSVDPAFPPATNDVCTGALAIGEGTNVLNPAESACSAYINDPLHGASCYTGATKTDRWYVFTPTTTGNYRIETCGSNFDTVLSLFDACGGGEIGCNDNYDTGPTTGCSSARSRIASVTLNAGIQYYIRVAAPISAFLSSSSVINLSILTAPATAPNDTCDNAAIATFGANPFDTTEATADPFIVVNCAAQSTQSRDVWFEFTTPAPGKLRVATCPGTSMNTVVSIHDGACGVELACNDNANVSGCTNQSIIENFVVAGGQTVGIRVAGNSSSALGAGVLTVSMDCDADLDNDGDIDLSDLATLLANFGCSSGCTVDLNADGLTDLTDLAIMLSSFGQPCQ
ncbi:MAG: hypothetical protein AMXMBFR47_08720 [Planctomycetota bacterium]